MLRGDRTLIILLCCSPDSYMYNEYKGKNINIEMCTADVKLFELLIKFIDIVKKISPF